MRRIPAQAESAPKQPGRPALPKAIAAMPPAAESAPDTSKYQSLKELTPQSAGIGTWLLQVAEAPRIWEYSYTYNGKQVQGKRFEVTLVSPDANVYCIGFVRRQQENLIGNGNSPKP